MITHTNVSNHYSTPIMVFKVTCVVVSLYPILRRTLGYTDDQQNCHQCHLDMTLGVEVRLLISWRESLFNIGSSAFTNILA
jgi:hypothetical protein